MDDLANLDAIAQADLVRSGQASPTELVDAAIKRIEGVNPDLNAVIHERFDKARDEAADELPDGPFRGVPMVVKDLMCHTAGDPFHEGIAGVRREGWVEKEDTELARRFKAAGVRDRRQDEHTRARDPPDHGTGCLRTVPQSLGHHSFDRRVEWRIRCRGGVRHGAGRPCQ